MKPADTPFEPLQELALDQDAFARLSGRPVLTDAAAVAATTLPAVVIGRLHGFDLLERPVLTDVSVAPGRLLAARSAVALRREQVGASLVLAFEDGDVERPIVLGVLERGPLDAGVSTVAQRFEAVVDGERRVIEAEREIVLRCGEASITLTRAGKVLIKGQQIVSRATGVNRIKGAAVDIN